MVLYATIDSNVSVRVTYPACHHMVTSWRDVGEVIEFGPHYCVRIAYVKWTIITNLWKQRGHLLTGTGGRILFVETKVTKHKKIVVVRATIVWPDLPDGTWPSCFRGLMLSADNPKVTRHTRQIWWNLLRSGEIFNFFLINMFKAA